MKSSDEVPTIRPTSINALQEQQRLLMFERWQAQLQQERNRVAAASAAAAAATATVMNVNNPVAQTQSYQRSYHPNKPICARPLVLSRSGRTRGIDRTRLVEVLNEALLISKEVLDEGTSTENNSSERHDTKK